MKLFKKATLLVLALGTVGALAACGGKGGGNDDLGGGNIQGEQLMDAAAWTQSLSDTSAATNATISMRIKGEDRMGEFFEKGESVVTAKVAEDKVYVYEKTDGSWYFEEDGVVDRDEEHDEDQTYIAMVDGVATRYFKELEQDWQISEWDGYDFSATVGFVLNWYADFNPMYVSGMYDAFENNNGTYTCTQTDDEGYSSTAELKFVDGQIAWGKISENSTRSYDGQTMTETWEVVFAITYGDTTIGALPGQEEEPDVGDDSSSAGGEIGGDNSGSAGGDDVGGDNSGSVGGDESGEVVVPKGEQVNAEGWESAINDLKAATNFISNVSMTAYLADGSVADPVMTGLATMTIADNKAYVVMTTKSGEYSFTNYSYCGNVDGKNYSWELGDGASWYCEEMGAAMDINGTWMWEEMFCTEMTFSNVTYNEETGAYKYVNDDGWYEIGFVNGKVAFFSYGYQDYMGSTAMDMVETHVFTYGNASVGDLPPVNNVSDGNDSMDSVGGGTTDEGSTGESSTDATMKV